MRPLKITCWLSSPLVGQPPMLDSLLQFAMLPHMPSIMATSNGHRHATALNPVRGLRAVTPGKIPIPLAYEWVNGWPVYHASSPIYATDWDGVQRISQHFPVQDAQMISPSQRSLITTGGGEFKSYLLPMRTRLIGRVVWFCLAGVRQRKRKDGSVGNQWEVPRIRKLLGGITGIGDNVRLGYGRVKEWSVEDVSEDYSWFAPSDTGKVLMRPLPTGDWLPNDLIGSKPSFGACCGPYWQAENFTEIVLPC